MLQKRVIGRRSASASSAFTSLRLRLQLQLQQQKLFCNFNCALLLGKLMQEEEAREIWTPMRCCVNDWLGIEPLSWLHMRCSTECHCEIASTNVLCMLLIGLFYHYSLALSFMHLSATCLCSSFTLECQAWHCQHCVIRAFFSGYSLRVKGTSRFCPPSWSVPWHFYFTSYVWIEKTIPKNWLRNIILMKRT